MASANEPGNSANPPTEPVLASSDEPYEIRVPDSALSDLQTRLALTKFPDELEGAEREYGVPLSDLQRLVKHWQESFDWRKVESQINTEFAGEMFLTNIDVEHFGQLSIHYVHRRSPVQNAIPLLFVHGWPGSFLEVRKILPLLTNASPENPAFHVVTFSLPNFGFSEGTKKKGFKIAQYAEVGHKLMLHLGYNQYVTQGGDWGHLITRTMAQVYGPKHLKAWHTNMAIANPPSLTSDPLLWVQNIFKPFSEEDKEALKRTNWFRNKGQGYSAIQSTQPQTIGYALTDSPAGLLAWIYEKLVNWTDSYQWTDDEVLTWVSIYWFSRAGPASSVRIYYEVFGAGRSLPKISSVPTGLSIFPKELIVLPKLWLQQIGKVVLESRHKTGGHFAAYEQPEALVNDLRTMFGKNGGAYGVVDGHSGFETKP